MSLYWPSSTETAAGNGEPQGIAGKVFDWRTLQSMTGEGKGYITFPVFLQGQLFL
jgi:hypothetical protein